MLPHFYFYCSGKKQKIIEATVKKNKNYYNYMCMNVINCGVGCIRVNCPNTQYIKLYTINVTNVIVQLETKYILSEWYCHL